jgi:hypothetical protein
MMNVTYDVYSAYGAGGAGRAANWIRRARSALGNSSWNHHVIMPSFDCPSGLIPLPYEGSLTDCLVELHAGRTRTLALTPEGDVVRKSDRRVRAMSASR